eukprot:4559829-Lingulodinium_polyedra.AAC.1
MPKQVVRSFGQWLRQHVRLRLKRGVLSWQWALVASCWCTEQAGIAQRFRTAPEEAAELVRQMGVHFRANRQKPFLSWRRGRLLAPR